MIHLRRPMSAQRPRVTERRTFARNAALFAVVATGMTAGPAHAAGQLVLMPHIPTLVILLVGFVVLIFPLNSMIFCFAYSTIATPRSRVQPKTLRAWSPGLTT